MTEDKGLTAEEALQAAYSEMTARFASQETGIMSFSRPVFVVHEPIGDVPHHIEMYREATSMRFPAYEEDWALSIGQHLYSIPYLNTISDSSLSLLAIPMMTFRGEGRIDGFDLEKFLDKREPAFFRQFTLIRAESDSICLQEDGFRSRYMKDCTLLRNIESYAIKPKKNVPEKEGEQKGPKTYSPNIVPAMCISIKAALQERFRFWDYGLMRK
ncbi:MAG: hypothetical protein V1866_03300 [archaeon]